MVKGMGPVSENATTVVRLFPDYAGSVIWFDGPVPYEETQLDAQLIADLQAWEASYYAGLTSDYSWSAPGLKTRFRTEGTRLARRLANELGDDFQVEHDVGDSQRRVRGAGPARNPEAAAAFHRLADAAREEWAHLRHVVAEAARKDTPWNGEPTSCPVPRHSTRDPRTSVSGLLSWVRGATWITKLGWLSAGEERP